MKKILAIFGAVAFALVGASMFAAFEAHVVNVTARIENALGVSTNALNFGTVFPQEHLDKQLDVQLSRSFLEEDRVDDVEYFIRQKPKCAITSQNGTVADLANTATGHVIPTQDDPATPEDESKGGTAYTIDCGPAPRQLTEGESWGVLPSLCEYISKEGDEETDGTTPSFHTPWTVSGGQVSWTDTKGRLAKSNQDVVDNWTIDLSVPCFGGYCAQDWEDFVHGINPDADPSAYTQPIGNEHKIFGCDLWVEVNHVSEVGEED